LAKKKGRIGMDYSRQISAGNRKPKAVIAGGGLAGLACAKRLVDAGFQIELVEAEPQLGGRTASWIDEDGQQVESGVHTFFGVYSRLIQLLNEVGVNDDLMVSWDDKVGFLQPGGDLSVFATDPVRDLAGVLGGVLGNNRLIGPLSKLSLGLTFINGLLQRYEYEERSVARLARDGALFRPAYERLLRPLSRGLSFCEPEELSAYVLLTLLQHGIFNPFNIRAGTFRGGMTEVMINPLARWLENRGATLRTSAKVSAIHHQAGQANGQVSSFELENGEMLTGDVYISALPLEAIKPMVPASLQELTYFRHLQELETVPATAVQLWFDRQFMKRNEFIYLSGSPLVVFQDESRITFPSAGSRISGQITARYTDNYSDRQLVDLALEELNRYIPASVGAQVTKSVVVRHQAIAIKPGVAIKRPRQASPVSNFFLAGDYTRQNWFTTMEGATRSGEMAAQAILRYLNYQAAERPGIIVTDVSPTSILSGVGANLVKKFLLPASTTPPPKRRTLKVHREVEVEEEPDLP
jgi:uncharacterized protein with NAD-binding domain and iron-sulfur cluster